MILENDEHIKEQVKNTPLNDEIITNLGWEEVGDIRTTDPSIDGLRTIIFVHQQFGGRSGTVTNKHTFFVYLKRAFLFAANRFVYKMYVVTWIKPCETGEKDEDLYHEEQYDIRTVFELVEQCNVLMTKIQNAKNAG